MSYALTPGTQILDNAIGPLSLSLFAGTGPRRTHPANTPAGLYGLALRSPIPPFAPLFLYVFPLGPQQIERSVIGAGNYYDVAGPASNFGVTRIPDIYGQTPPLYRIRGTTGVKYHSADHYLFTGLQSILILSSIITQYFALNAQQASLGNPNLYILEFYDYYMSQFWQVVPLGPQRLLQDIRQGPQLVYYEISLIATQSLYQPVGAAVDQLLSAVGQGIQNLFTQTQSNFDDLTPNYSLYNIVNPVF